MNLAQRILYEGLCRPNNVNPHFKLELDEMVKLLPVQIVSVPHFETPRILAQSFSDLEGVKKLAVYQLYPAYWMENSTKGTLIYDGKTFDNETIYSGGLFLWEKGVPSIFNIVAHRFEKPKIIAVWVPSSDPHDKFGVYTISDLTSRSAYDANGDMQKIIQQATTSMNTLWPMFAAHNLLRCSNITVTDTEIHPDRIKRARRLTTEPTLVYKTLVVRVPKEQAKAYGREWVNFDEMPMHSVRGHFKKYTAEKPLFGKYVGEFFCPPFVKGTPDNGTISKDYKLDGNK